ncbi:hypothetical protein, partial [Marinobacter alexandrii]|uniref:hypothetical protein n=1 Tax=Marinobacter alexandrii TaxID=2570351 RepID=UPI003296DC38
DFPAVPRVQFAENLTSTDASHTILYRSKEILTESVMGVCDTSHWAMTNQGNGPMLTTPLKENQS